MDYAILLGAQGVAPFIPPFIDGVTHRVVRVDANGRIETAAPGVSYTGGSQTAVNVTVASAQVLAANANRKYLLLINDSDTAIYLALFGAAAVNLGIRLNPNGSSYEMSAQLGNLYLGAITGIHGGVGNKLILITEGT